MKHLTALQDLFQAEVDQLNLGTSPSKLYDPMHYIMQLGGKRLRPILSLMGAGIYGDPSKAMPQAMAIELFHNFSLIHDDIMDAAPLRRGKITVHKKWDDNVGILSGDGMLVKAYQYLAQCDAAILPEVLGTFSQTALEVCEGQQMDMDFESMDEVAAATYIQMIQIKDDYLDVYGDPEKFGKQVGGDILSNKKTLLWIEAQRRAAVQNIDFGAYAAMEPSEEKVHSFQELYKILGVDAYAKAQIDHYYQLSLEALDSVEVPAEKLAPLKEFAAWLYSRES